MMRANRRRRCWRRSLAPRLCCVIPAAVRVAEPIFVESAAATGLAFTHHNGATGQYYMPELMGAGVALFDYDGDGDLDVFLVQGGRARRLAAGSADQPPVPQRPLGRRRRPAHAAFHRRHRRAPASAGAGTEWVSAVADYDNDGDLDLLAHLVRSRRALPQQWRRHVY